jgi:2-methylcitrate dehydratase
MTNPTSEENIRPEPDQELTDIADYVVGYEVTSDLALETARYALMDALGCAVLALRHPECRKLLGPLLPGTVVPDGVRIPGTQFVLDPVQGAFNIGTMVRWLDFNDTWLAAEWGHPSDNLGAILAVADHVGRKREGHGKRALVMLEVLQAMVKAYEIQGGLALENAFNRVGLDHVVLVKVASAAVATHLLGGGREEIVDALSQAWVDGHSLRVYRHAPNAGPRKSWAAGDATARGVQLALLTMKGEMGYPGALTARTWGFYDVLFGGRKFRFQRPYSSYVMENILFKVSFPAEFHAQTAVEAALRLHPLVRDRLEEVREITLFTQEPALRIITKTGPLHNPADRDHCLQYMVAVALIFGELTAEYYGDKMATDPRLDALRSKMNAIEDPRYSREYLDPDKRSIANAVQVHFQDGSSTEKVEVEYPVGHRRRRDEGLPKLIEKLERNLASRFPPRRVEAILKLCGDKERFEAAVLHEFMELLAF